MLHPDTHLLLHHTRAAELQAEAAQFAISHPPKPAPEPLRTRLGWTLVEIGLHLATQHHPKPAKPIKLAAG